jgi:hypothetical protein
VEKIDVENPGSSMDTTGKKKLEKDKTFGLTEKTIEQYIIFPGKQSSY